MQNNKIIEKYSKSINLKKLKRSSAWRLESIEKRSKDAQIFSKNTINVNCPVCGESGFESLVCIYGFEYVACLSCTHVYIKNPPNNESLLNYYENNIKEISLRPSRDLVQKDLYKIRVNEIAKPKVSFVTDVLGKFGKWVDIGCGSGEVLYAAKNLGWDTLGFEIDPDEIFLAKQFGLNVKNIKINEQNGAGFLSEADVISLISVLEHVANPKNILSVVSKFAKKDVCLVLELPHHPSLSAFSNIMFPDLIARHMLPPNHLSIFTEKSVKKFLYEFGFEPTHIWYYGQDISELMETIFLNNKLNKQSSLLSDILKLLPSLQKKIDEQKMCDEFLIITRRI